LATLMRASETGRGALQQMLFAVGDERTAVEQDPQPAPPPAWLPDYMRRLRRAPHPGQGIELSLADIFNGTASLPPQQVVIPFKKADLDSVYAELDAVSSDRRVRSLLLGARAIARRIAAVLAAWQAPDHPCVTREIMEWVGGYVADRMRETVEQFDVLHSHDGRSSVYDQVLTKIVESRGEGLAAGMLPKVCWPFRGLSAKQRGELIELMLADETIFEISHRPKVGRPGKRYVAARFVQQEGV
jgi:hypothetical protein